MTESRKPHFVVFQMVEPGDVDDVYVLAVADTPDAAFEIVREAFIDLRNQVVHDSGGPEVDIDVHGSRIQFDAENPVTPGELAALDQAWKDATTTFHRQVLDAEWTAPKVFRSDLSDTTYVVQRLDP